MTPKGGGQTRHADGELMLEDLIRRPSILPRLGVMDILTIGQNLTLSTVEGPCKDDFVFAATAVGPLETLRETFSAGHPKFESDLLL